MGLADGDIVGLGVGLADGDPVGSEVVGVAEGKSVGSEVVGAGDGPGVTVRSHRSGWQYGPHSSQGYSFETNRQASSSDRPPPSSVIFHSILSPQGNDPPAGRDQTSAVQLSHPHLG